MKIVTKTSMFLFRRGRKPDKCTNFSNARGGRGLLKHVNDEVNNGLTLAYTSSYYNYNNSGSTK